MVDSLYGAFVGTQVNEMSYLLRAFTHEYPTTGSVRAPALVHDVQAPLHPDMPEVEAMVELGLDQNTAQELVCRSITTYDPASLRKAFAASGREEDMDGLTMSEETVDHIDRRTGWLTASNTIVTLKSTGVRARVVTNTVLKPLLR
jgi:hypothetical protein